MFRINKEYLIKEMFKIIFCIYKIVQLKHKRILIKKHKCINKLKQIKIIEKVCKNNSKNNFRI